MVPDIGFIISSAARRLSFCFAAATSERRKPTLPVQSGLRKRSNAVVEIRPFDAVNYLESEEDVLFYLESAMVGNDPKHIASAIGNVARSKGMTEIAKKTGLGRQALYNALSDNGNPTLETLLAVLGALGFELSVKKRAA